MEHPWGTGMPWWKVVMTSEGKTYEDAPFALNRRPRWKRLLRLPLTWWMFYSMWRKLGSPRLGSAKASWEMTKTTLTK